MMETTTADTADLVKETTDASFKKDVLDASMTQPVLVDFWAPWCGPCRTLTPIIEKAVKAAKGKVKLVKINIDANPAYAQQLRVQSIPAVFAFDKGRPVDGFMGALPESQVKSFIERLTGGPDEDGVEAVLARAKESLDLGDLGGAAQDFAQAVQLDPENPKALAGLARCYLLGEDVERAEEILAMVPPKKANDPDVVSVKAAISLATAAANAGDDVELRAALAANPDDHQARFDLATALAGRGDVQGAVDELLTIVAKDRAWNDDGARKQLVTIFEAEGFASPISKDGRKRLSTLLFS
jgi:putative thioredoxin